MITSLRVRIGQTGQRGIVNAGQELVQADVADGLTFGQLQPLTVGAGPGQLLGAVRLASEAVVLQLTTGAVAPGGRHLVDGGSPATFGRALGLVVELWVVHRR